MSKKFTFKKQPKPTGLARIGAGEGIIIKYLGKKCGNIVFPNYSSNRKGWYIQLLVKFDDREINEDSPCQFRNIILKYKPTDAEDAKKFLNDNFEAIMKKYTLHLLED